MASFKDSEGMEWQVRFTLPLVPRLRAAGYDLGKVGGKGEALDALTDPEKVGQILWIACESQAEKRSITPEQFAERFDGPTIHAAVEAVYAATADFTQRPDVAAKIKAALPDAMSRADRAMADLIETRLKSIGSNSGAGNSPGSPESTPSG